jgi:hypothetical protein
MSDPRLPLEEDSDLGEIEEVEDGEDAVDAQDGEDGNDAEDAQGGDEEAEGDAEEDGPRRDVRQPSRRESRIARTTRENAELRERLANLEGRLSAPQPQQQADPYAAQRAAEAERELLATFTPEQISQHFYQKGMQQTQQALHAIRIEGLDRSDKAAFESRAERSAARAQLAAEVEKTAQQYLRQGQLANREDIFAYLFGKEALRKAERGQSPRARQGAQRRVAAQTTRPGSGRGDVARSANRGRSQEDDDRRLLERTVVGDVI